MMSLALHLKLKVKKKKRLQICYFLLFPDKMPLNDVISLNVGGVSMATTRATLLSDPKSSLARMFQEDSEIPPAKIKDGEFFLDLDPKCFEVLLEPVYSRAQTKMIFLQVVLTWLRHRQLVLPLVHKTFGLAINRDYFSTVFTSDHPFTV